MAWVYEPETKSWEAKSWSKTRVRRFDHGCWTLGDEAFVGQGWNAELSSGLVDTEVYNPTTGRFAPGHDVSAETIVPELNDNVMRRSFAYGFYDGKPTIIGGIQPYLLSICLMQFFNPLYKLYIFHAVMIMS